MFSGSKEVWAARLSVTLMLFTPERAAILILAPRLYIIVGCQTSLCKQTLIAGEQVVTCPTCPELDVCSTVTMTIKSQQVNPHLADASLRPFLSPSFSPIDYLNATLPSSTTTKQQQSAPSLSTIASQTQSHISTLNAQTTRLSATLTGLTDDILRTSSRLAYEVELLRGEALSLADSLSSRGELQESIQRFVPNGLDQVKPSTDSLSSPSKARHDSQAPATPSASIAPDQLQDPKTSEPEALPRLHTLLHVRAQLQTVIQRFNLALSFPFPPSLLATATSSLISVNPPNQDPDLENKGQAALSRFRQEVLDLLADIDGRGGGIERARQRIEELREICNLWKGTGEEKARLKWVDGLEVMVDDEVRMKEEGKRKGIGGKKELKRETSAMRGQTDGGGSGPGFLRRLRDEIYVE